MRWSSQVTNHVSAKTSQSYKTSELFSLSLQPSRIGLHTSPVLNRWPFRRRCLVSSSIFCLRWYLFSCNSPQIYGSGGSSRKRCSLLCLSMGFQYSRWAPLTLIQLTWRIWSTPNNAIKWQMGFNSAFKGLIQPWMAHLADVSEIPQVGSCPICERADPLLASWSTVSFSEILVGSSVICLRCYLFNCNSPQICGSGDSSRKHCTLLCLNMGFQYSRWALLIQPWIAHLAGVSEIPQVGSCPICECADPLLASWSTVSFSEILLFVGTHTSCIMLCTTSLFRDWWQSPTSVKLMWKLSSALIAAWLSVLRYGRLY